MSTNNHNHNHDSDISEGHDNRTKNNKESSPTKMTNQYNTSPKSSSYVPMAALLSASAQIKNINDNSNPPQRSSALANNNNDDNQNSQNNIKNNILNKFPQPSSSAANQNLLNNFSNAAASISTSGVILPNHFENLTIGENKINEQPNSGKYVNKSNLYNGSNLNGDSLEYYSHSPLDGEMHQNLRLG